MINMLQIIVNIIAIIMTLVLVCVVSYWIGRFFDGYKYIIGCEEDADRNRYEQENHD